MTVTSRLGIANIPEDTGMTVEMADQLVSKQIMVTMVTETTPVSRDHAQLQLVKWLRDIPTK